MTGSAAEGVLSRERFDAVLFDMDGVVTDTARAHATAWQRLFDEFLEKRAADRGESFVPFDPECDYRAYVDGKARLDGVRDFLEARGISLPEGAPEDPPERQSIFGLGRRKNLYFHQFLNEHRVQVFATTLDLIRALKECGTRVAVFSASQNAASVLESAGVLHLFDVAVDGNDLARLGLPGKPHPAILLESARRLEVEPARTAVVEDAIAGIEAGRRGSFGLVIGVDRSGEGAALKDAGADLVVRDLSEVRLERGQTLDRLPSAWEGMDEVCAGLAGGRLVVFLDYDGTLTAIVDDPEQAVLSNGMRIAIARLAKRCPVAVISGRSLADVRARVGLDQVVYAGSHGFEIAGPAGTRGTLEKGREALPDLDAAEHQLNEELAPIEGHTVERKPFSIAIHHRRVDEARTAEVEQIVDRVVARHPTLRKGTGKKVFQVQPDIQWNKGCAVLWVLDHLDLGPEALPVYIGDDVTDEDAFRALEGRGIGIAVRGGTRSTKAAYALHDPEDVRRFLEALASLPETSAR